MQRSYISEIKSVREWKLDELYLYSDAHKDAYGFRSYPSHLLEPQHTMEEVMNEVASIYRACDEACERERKRELRARAHSHYHWLMLQEASRHPRGIVFKNPNWEDGDSYEGAYYYNDPYGKNYYGEREYGYYIAPAFTNDQMSQLGWLI